MLCATLCVNLPDVLNVLKSSSFDGSLHTRKQKNVSSHRVGWITLVGSCPPITLKFDSKCFTVRTSSRLISMHLQKHEISMTNFILSTEFHDMLCATGNCCHQYRQLWIHEIRNFQNTVFTSRFLSLSLLTHVTTSIFLLTLVTNLPFLGQFWTDTPAHKIIILSVHLQTRSSHSNTLQVTRFKLLTVIIVWFRGGCTCKLLLQKTFTHINKVTGVTLIRLGLAWRNSTIHA
jgi:hypothetical protein